MDRMRLGFLLVGFCVVTGCESQSARIERARQPSATSQSQPAKPGAQPRYLDTLAIQRLESVLPDPPVDRGTLTRGEGDLMLALQAEATPAAKTRAKSEESFQVWAFADVLGPGFSREKLPRTAALMRQAEHDSAVVTRALKEHWDRKRPPLQDDRIVATLGLPKEASYPSGHSVRAMLWASLLAKIVPDKEQELRQRARLVAYDRVIGGVHYPTDVAAGLTLGGMIADEIAKSPVFQAELDQVRSEWSSRP